MSLIRQVHHASSIVLLAFTTVYTGSKTIGCRLRVEWQGHTFARDSDFLELAWFSKREGKITDVAIYQPGNEIQV
ncbi:hypothetical protein EDD22DRAFT_562997 [Suillus occidentalis]|nr:hypothetical protein EDD22DRAFT_562997 [Suillus occidentalis]